MSALGATHIDTFRSYEACQSLAREWNEIVSRQSTEIHQLDITSSFDWAMALWETHLQKSDQDVLVLRHDGKVAGILPLYRFRKSIRRFPCRSVAQFTELCGGRTGFVMRELRQHYLESLFDHIDGHLKGWDALLFTTVDGSQHERLLLEAAHRREYLPSVIERERSAYIPFCESWERHFSSLPKKLRATMRNGQKRLGELGRLSYREYCSAENVNEFLDAIEEIEKHSWKAEAGTAIASNAVHQAFHRTLAVRAAASGWFSGHLLFLDGEPLAYVMGLLHNGIFLDLKESYKAPFREMSPGHVLKFFMFERLYELGTRIYDFMGKCEEYKMKWTDRTYSRSTYMLFNRSLRGRAADFMSRIGRRSACEPRDALQEGIGGAVRI